jgi:hypothetical protein
MADARLQAELHKTKAELQRLRENVHRHADPLHKDMSLITLIPKWTGSESDIAVDEFLASVESAAEIGRWQDDDMCVKAALKLAGTAKQLFQGCTDLHREDVTWQTFKTAFRHRCEDVRTDQFHFTRLHTTRRDKMKPLRNLRPMYRTGLKGCG